MDIHDEAKTLATTGEHPQLQSLQALTHAFISKRMGNSSEMENTKRKALDLLLKKLEEDPDAISASKLMDIINMLSVHTGNDLKVLMEVQTALAAGKPGAGGQGVTNIFFGGGEQPEDSSGRKPTASRATYKLLDALDSIAQNIASSKKNAETVEVKE